MLGGLFCPPLDQDFCKHGNKQPGAQGPLFLVKRSPATAVCWRGSAPAARLITGGVRAPQVGLMLAGLPRRESDKQISILENGMKLNRYQPDTLSTECQCY